MNEEHDDFDPALYATIDDRQAKTIHVMDPFAGSMFGSAFDEDGTLRQQQFEKYGRRVRLIHDDDQIHLEGMDA